MWVSRESRALHGHLFGYGFIFLNERRTSHRRSGRQRDHTSEAPSKLNLEIGYSDGSNNKEPETAISRMADAGRRKEIHYFAASR
jgi:hypothetical protein